MASNTDAEVCASSIVSLIILKPLKYGQLNAGCEDIVVSGKYIDNVEDSLL